MGKVVELPKARCWFCGREATKLCDKVKGEYRTLLCGDESLNIKEGLATCDKRICDNCATHIDGADYCPDCVNKLRQGLRR